MKGGQRLHTVELTDPKRLQTLVENRRVFSLDNCELNVYESYEQAYQVNLHFNNLLITSMVRGHKVMHLSGRPALDYLPGETLIVPAHEKLIIDFPHAHLKNPTQCVALAVDAGYIRHTISFLNNYYQVAEGHEPRTLHFSQYHFQNDADTSTLINKLISVCSSGNPDKNIYADLNLKELLIRLIQSQHLQQVATDNSISGGNQSRQHYVLKYIHDHLTEKIAVDTLSRKAYLSRNTFFRWFKDEFGITPLEYINRERVNMAKKMLARDGHTVNSVSAECGFTDPNYFIRIFKKQTGITPKAFQLITAR